MCGILGVFANGPVNQVLYDGLLVLQHRGQDAAGIVTAQGPAFHMHKGSGLVRDVFRTRNMRALAGHRGHRAHPLPDRRLGMVGTPNRSLSMSTHPSASSLASQRQSHQRRTR